MINLRYLVNAVDRILYLSAKTVRLQPFYALTALLEKLLLDPVWSMPSDDENPVSLLGE